MNPHQQAKITQDDEFQFLDEKFFQTCIIIIGVLFQRKNFDTENGPRSIHQRPLRSQPLGTSQALSELRLRFAGLYEMMILPALMTGTCLMDVWGIIKKKDLKCFREKLFKLPPNHLRPI